MSYRAISNAGLLALCALCAVIAVESVTSMSSVSAQSQLDFPTQLRDRNGQTLIDLTQGRNYVSLERWVCEEAGAAGQTSNCNGLELYLFTLKDGTRKGYYAVPTAAAAPTDPKWRKIQSCCPGMLPCAACP